MDPSCCELACDLQTSENPCLQLGEANKMEPQMDFLEKNLPKASIFRGDFLLQGRLRGAVCPPPNSQDDLCATCNSDLCDF